MSIARKDARVTTACALFGLLAVVFLALPAARVARAEETTPSPAAAEKAPPTAAAEKPPAATVPTPAPDSSSTSAAAPALRDSSANAPEPAVNVAKDLQQAERIENATTTPIEKPAEATPVPATALTKPADTPAKVLKTPPSAGVARKPRVTAGTGLGGARAVKPSPKNRAPAQTLAPRNQYGIIPRSVHEGFTEADRVSSELERTERFVGRAQKSILSSKNTRAIKLFTSALDFQSDSREACKVRQYARAERLTLAARDFADRATRMVGPPREDPDFVEHVLRRTDDALERAKDVLQTGAGRDSWRQHEDLKQEQKEAWRVFKAGDVVGAYRETQGVREGVLALLRQLQDLPVPRETAEKAIGGAQMALDQANKELGPKPSVEAVRLVRLANEYLAKARQSFSRGSYRSALLQAKVVERHVEHAVDVGRPRSAG